MGILAIVECQTPFTVQLGFENPTLAGKGLVHQCRKHRTEPVRLCTLAHTFSYLWRQSSDRIREIQNAPQAGRFYAAILGLETSATTSAIFFGSFNRIAMSASVMMPTVRPCSSTTGILLTW